MRTAQALLYITSDCFVLHPLDCNLLARELFTHEYLTMASATRCTASCAVRLGRYPYEPGWKSASKMGSRMSVSFRQACVSGAQALGYRPEPGQRDRKDGTWQTTLIQPKG